MKNLRKEERGTLTIDQLVSGVKPIKVQDVTEKDKAETELRRLVEAKTDRKAKELMEEEWSGSVSLLSALCVIAGSFTVMGLFFAFAYILLTYFL